MKRRHTSIVTAEQYADAIPTSASPQIESAHSNSSESSPSPTSATQHKQPKQSIKMLISNMPIMPHLLPPSLVPMVH